MGDVKVDPYPNLPLSGQLIGLVTGTPYALPNIGLITRAVLGAHPGNSGVIYVGNSTGTVGNDTGFPLSADGISLSIEGLKSFGMLYANFEAADDVLCWFVLDNESEEPIV